MVLKQEIVLLQAVLKGWYAISFRNVLFLRNFAYFCSPFLKKILTIYKTGIYANYSTVSQERKTK